MRRVPVLIALVMLPGLFASCGGPSGNALDTLPPMSTTTSTTTVTTAPFGGRIFYVVNSGDYLTDIAARYQVTVQSIIELNGLTTDVLQPGQELEIPNDLRVDLTPPPLPGASSSTAP
jgi:LysM repeat protein